MKCLGIIDGILIYIIITIALWMFVSNDAIKSGIKTIVGLGIFISIIFAYIGEEGTWTDVICTP